MTTFVFPGQGSQFQGMTNDFYDNFVEARDIFNLISDTTKIDIKDIILNNPSDLLNQTKYTQLAIFCSSISIFKVLTSKLDISNMNIKYMLGHSLGEYTALTAAKIISIQDCAKLLKIRGELMHNAYEPYKSGMAALIGINCNKVENIILNNNLKIEIANDNSPIQVVISGKKNEINNSEKIFKENGVKKFINLNVSAAFHSFLMKDAQNTLNKNIQNTKFNNSSISIISNFSGKFANNIDEIINNLSNQMSNRVRWVESIQSLEKISENKVIEIGPGKVLTGLIKRISNNFDISNIEYVTDIDKIKNEI